MSHRVGVGEIDRAVSAHLFRAFSRAILLFQVLDPFLGFWCWMSMWSTNTAWNQELKKLRLNSPCLIATCLPCLFQTINLAHTMSPTTMRSFLGMWTSLFKQSGLSQVESIPVRPLIGAQPSWGLSGTNIRWGGWGADICRLEEKAFSGEGMACNRSWGANMLSMYKKYQNTSETGVWEVNSPTGQTNVNKFYS